MRTLVSCLLLLTEAGLWTRVKSANTVAEIPEQHPYTSIDNTLQRIPDFLYQLKPMTNQKVSKSKYPMCGVVLRPYFVTFVVNFKGYVSTFTPGCNDCFTLAPEFHYVHLQPTSATEPDLKEISTCNPNQDKTCTACVNGGTGVEVFLKVYRGNSNDALVWEQINEPLLYVPCFYMRQVDCGPRFCTNGEYTSTYLKLDSNGFVISKTKCVPCAPGSWLTCQNDANCAYDIPSSAGSFDGGGQIYMPAGEEPVGACFSCESAGGNKMHYGKTNLAIGISIGASTPLAWYCPGGLFPPVMCKTPFAGSYGNHTYCSCGPGDYFVGGLTGCLPCPPGSMCPEGVRMDCPDDTYQSLAGGTACNNCLFEGSQSNSCEINGQKMRRCRGPFKSQSPLCVQCNACIHAYESSSAGVVDCY